MMLILFARDPVDCYESNYVYMGLQNAFKMDINEFAASEKVIFKDNVHNLISNHCRHNQEL